MPFSKKPAKNPGNIVTTSKRIQLMIEADAERRRSLGAVASWLTA
jgi:hypothetical protein